MRRGARVMCAPRMGVRAPRTKGRGPGRSDRASEARALRTHVLHSTKRGNRHPARGGRAVRIFHQTKIFAPMRCTHGLRRAASCYEPRSFNEPRSSLIKLFTKRQRPNEVRMPLRPTSCSAERRTEPSSRASRELGRRDAPIIPPEELAKLIGWEGTQENSPWAVWVIPRRCNLGTPLTGRRTSIPFRRTNDCPAATMM